MQAMKPRRLGIQPALVALLVCAVPASVLSAPPTPPVPEKIATPAASQDSAVRIMQSKAKAKAGAGQPRDGKKLQRPADESAKQPYRALVDTVRKSTDAFGDDNVSESGERDRLQDPPPR